MVCKDFFVEINELDFSTEYEYRVKSFCQNGASISTASRVFLTKNPALFQPPKVLRADEIADNSALLSWENPPGAIGFDLRWRPFGGQNWHSTPNLTKNFDILEQLEPAHHYEFSVRSRGKSSPSDWSAAFVFTTASAGSGCPPPNGVLAFDIHPTSAKIKWSGAPEAAEFVFRYKKEGSGGWKTISTTNFSVDLTNLWAGKTILFQVKSSCGGGESSVWSVLQKMDLPPELSCNPVANGSDEWIQSVQIADFQRVTGKNGGYGYFADEPILVQKNRSFPIQIAPGFSGISFFENYAVWLDADQDGKFDEANEQVFARETCKDSLVSGQIFIPDHAKIGLTHLRVMMRYSPISSSCGDIVWGEVEDYLVKIDDFGAQTTNFGNNPVANSDNFIDLGDGRGASVFPNPTVDWVKIQFPGSGEATLIDATGRTLAHWLLASGDNNFDVQFLPRGIYSLVLVGGRLPVAVKIYKG